MYNYFRFLDKFHTEPASFMELIDFMNFSEVSISIDNIARDLRSK